MEVITGRESAAIWGWAETPNVRVTGDKDKPVRQLEASSLHWCTHTLLPADGYKMGGASQKVRTILIFTLLCFLRPSLDPSSSCTSIAINRWVACFFYVTPGEKKCAAAVQSASAEFCPELMKSHAYWDWSCCHGDDEPTTGICLCFKAKLSHGYPPWARKRSLFFLSAKYCNRLRQRHLCICLISVSVARQHKTSVSIDFNNTHDSSLEENYENRSLELSVVYI